MKKAIMAASLDPITHGHVNIVQRASKVFDHITVGVGINRKKSYAFSIDERVEMARKAFFRYGDRVTVLPFSGLLVDFAYTRKIDTIIRGVRNSIIDFDFESLLNQVNQSQRAGIDTYTLFADPRLSHISSSVAKDLTYNFSSDLLSYVPMFVKMRLEEKLLNQKRIGVTGEIGAGKSYVTLCLAQLLREADKEVHVIDMDDIGRYILTESEEPIANDVREQIFELLGKDIKNEKSSMVDLKKMGKKLWGVPGKVVKFSEIMFNPTILEYTKRLEGKEGIILINSALFVESNMLSLCNNNILVVTADEKIRRERLLKRGYSKKEAEDRMGFQLSFTAKSKAISLSIETQNCGTMFSLENSVEKGDSHINAFFHREYSKLVERL